MYASNLWSVDSVRQVSESMLVLFLDVYITYIGTNKEISLLDIFHGCSLKVPLYIIAQLMGSILASGTLALALDVTPEAFFGTVPVGSDGQSLVLEIIISFLLMFVISGVSTDDRAVCSDSSTTYLILSIVFSLIVEVSVLAGGRSCWDCCWNDYTLECLRCWVIFLPYTIQFKLMNLGIMREIGFTKQSTESKIHVTCYFFAGRFQELR